MNLNKTQAYLIREAAGNARRQVGLTNQPRKRRAAEQLAERGILRLVTSYVEREVHRGRTEYYATSVWALTAAGEELAG